MAPLRRPEGVRRGVQQQHCREDRRLDHFPFGEVDGHGEEAEQQQVHRVLLVVVVQRPQHCTTYARNNQQIKIEIEANGARIALRRVPVGTARMWLVLGTAPGEEDEGPGRFRVRGRGDLGRARPRRDRQQGWCRRQEARSNEAGATEVAGREASEKRGRVRR